MHIATKAVMSLQEHLHPSGLWRQSYPHCPSVHLYVILLELLLKLLSMHGYSLIMAKC